MRKPRKKKLLNTQRTLKRNIVGRLKFAIDLPNLMPPSGVSSANSNISKAMSSRKPKKPQPGSNRSNKSSIKLNTSNASSVASSSVTSSTASPSTSRTKKNRRALDYFGFENSVCSISDDPAPVSRRQKTANPVIETILQEEASQPPATETEFELPVVSPPAPPPVGTWSPESYEYDDYAREISMSVFDAENQI